MKTAKISVHPAWKWTNRDGHTGSGKAKGHVHRMERGRIRRADAKLISEELAVEVEQTPVVDLEVCQFSFQSDRF